MSLFAKVYESEYDVTLKEMNSANTLRAIDVSWNIFQSYLREKNIMIDPSTVYEKRPKRDSEIILC